MQTRAQRFDVIGKRLVVMLGAAVCGVGAGCSAYEAPMLDVIDAHVTERTDEGVALAFVVQAANTNEEGLPLKEASYSLDLDGKRVFSGARSPEATLRREGTQQFRLPAGVPLAALAGVTGVVRYRLVGDLEYVTPGAFAEVLFDTGVRRPHVSFEREGTIDLSAAAIPRESFQPVIPRDPEEEEAEGDGK